MKRLVFTFTPRTCRRRRAALLPEGLRIIGALSGLPFGVIGAIAARRQWRLPSAARVAETQQALATMAWSALAALLEQAFRRDGYNPSWRPVVVRRWSERRYRSCHSLATSWLIQQIRFGLPMPE